mgnify:CR=1 FL=1
MAINKDGLDTTKPVDFKTLMRIESERKQNAKTKPASRKKAEAETQKD